MKKVTLIGASLLLMIASTAHAETPTVSMFSFLDLFKLEPLKERIIVLTHGDKRPPPAAMSIESVKLYIVELFK